MQIKKGPYGYYAMEKFDDPDILCSYAEEVIAGNRSDFYLKPDSEYIGSGIMCCYEFSGFLQITDPEFSVLSSGKRNPSHKKETRNLSLRRRSAGDLFYSFISFLDHLVAPSCIVLDPDMVFTDAEGITIKLCCLPIKSKPEDLCLSSLNAGRFERLLNCDFFKSIITDDERNALVYSVRENNEELFLKTADIIRGSVGNGSTVPESSDTVKSGNSKEKTHARTKHSKEEKDLITACLSAFLSFVLLARNMLLPCFLFFILSVIILMVTILNQKKRESSINKEETLEKSRQRSSILFSEETSVNADNSSDQIPGTRETNTLQPLVCGQLSLISDSNKANSSYSLYLDETCIGSDCFLSDIVIDDPGIAPLHARILLKNGSFYLEAAEGTGKTYLEDSPVENGKTYEIKTGQKITFGDFDFRFRIQTAVKNEF